MTSTSFIVISNDATLRSFLNTKFDTFLSFDTLQDIERGVDPTKQPLVLDLRQSPTQSVKSILQHLGQHYNFADDSVIVLTSHSFLYDNVYFEKYLYLRDMIALDSSNDMRLIKRISNMAGSKGADSSAKKSIKDSEFQKTMYQLNEIFLFEENLQLDFFEMDISNVVQLLLNKISNSISNEFCLFFTHNKEERILEFSSASKKSLLNTELRIDLENEQSVDEFISKQMPVFDHKANRFFNFYANLKRVFGFDIQSGMLVPVFRLDDLYGVIVCLNKKYEKKFTELDLTFTQITANKVDKVLDERQSWKQFATESNSVNTELRVERDELKDLLNSMDFGIVIFSKDGKVFFCNDRTRSIFEKNAHDQIEALQDIFTDEIQQIIANAMQEAIHQPIKSEFVFSKEDKLIATVGYTMSKYFITEINDLGFILTLKDITRAENDKENLYRVDKLASLGVLASGIAHEIRNPLAGIRTMAETLSGELENTEQQEYTDRIIRQVIRLSSLLKSFFTFAKPARPEKKKTSIQLLFKEIFPLLKNKMEERNINLTEYYEKELDDIFIDPNQIEQVFFNVLLNAIEAMPKGGELFFTAKPASNFSQIINRSKFKFKLTDHSYMEISIRDTGIGMSQDTIDVVFDPFYTKKAEGTGLGLSIVHQIISEHNGLIDISSELNEGTDFRIYLPIGGEEE